ncbi:MAG: hypothetical protein U0165_12695 [Polyangiaceae bacterium]
MSTDVDHRDDATLQMMVEQAKASRSGGDDDRRQDARRGRKGLIYRAFWVRLP